MTTIRHLAATDRHQWQPLWLAYQRFYEADIPAETTELTWERFHDEREPMFALGAFDDEERMVGIVHVIFHRSCWLPQWTCYLQDLYVDSNHRGGGTGAALIEAAAALARSKDAGKLYWLTQEANATARRLYDRISQQTGFIQYSKPL